MAVAVPLFVMVTVVVLHPANNKVKLNDSPAIPQKPLDRIIPPLIAVEAKLLLLREPV